MEAIRLLVSNLDIPLFRYPAFVATSLAESPTFRLEIQEPESPQSVKERAIKWWNETVVGTTASYVLRFRRQCLPRARARLD
jgi:hypothetical protein